MRNQKSENIAIVKVQDLENMLTEQVARHIADGYVLDLKDMRSWENGEVAHIDLHRAGSDELLRIALLEDRDRIETHDGNTISVRTIELCELRFEHAHTSYRCLFDGHADQRTTLGKWYKINGYDDAPDVYTDLPGIIVQHEIHARRENARKQHADSCINGHDNMRRVAEIIRHRRGYARTRIADIERVTVPQSL